MKFCPLLQKNCIKEQCAWWRGTKDAGTCAVVDTPGWLCDILTYLKSQRDQPGPKVIKEP